MSNPNDTRISKLEAKHKCRERMGLNISAYQIGAATATWYLNGEYTVVVHIIFCPFCGENLPENLKDVR